MDTKEENYSKVAILYWLVLIIDIGLVCVLLNGPVTGSIGMPYIVLGGIIHLIMFVYAFRGTSESYEESEKYESEYGVRAEEHSSDKGVVTPKSVEKTEKITKVEKRGESTTVKSSVRSKSKVHERDMKTEKVIVLYKREDIIDYVRCNKCDAIITDGGSCSICRINGGRS